MSSLYTKFYFLGKSCKVENVSIKETVTISTTYLKYFKGKHFFLRNLLTLWLYWSEMSLVYK